MADTTPTEPMSDLLFDLSLTEEQRIARESVRRFAQAEMAPVSRSADEAAEAPSGFYDKSLELGLALTVVPESLGGAGMPRSPISNVLNTEDLATGDMSLAIGALTPLSFVNLILDQGSEDQIESYLGRFTTGEFKSASIALMEPRAAFDPMRIETTAEKQGNSYVINGAKTMVPLAGNADPLLVIAELAGEGPQGFIVDRGTDGITLKDEEHMGLRALELNRVEISGVKVPASARLGGADGHLDLQRLVDLGRLGLCALAVGVCQATLDYVIPYCNERVAFDEPITNRQSVAFMIGNMATELEAMHLMVYRGASMAEQGLDFHKQTYLTRIQCAKYSMLSGTNGVQLLGGHGFTREHPVELWYRNLRAVGIAEGLVIL